MTYERKEEREEKTNEQKYKQTNKQTLKKISYGSLRRTEMKKKEGKRSLNRKKVYQKNKVM